MKNYDEVRNEYIKFDERFKAIESRRLEMVGQYPEYNDEWNKLPCNRNWKFTYYDKEKEEWVEEVPKPIVLSDEELTRLEKEYKEYNIEHDKVLDKVLAIEQEKEDLEVIYNAWKEENDIFEKCKEWGNELFGHYPWRDEYDYEDWASDPETGAKVDKSIAELDENEVAKFIDNARNALNSIGYTRDEDYREVHDYIDYIEYINRDMRHDIPNGCMSVFSLDILENRGLWIPYKEGFKECIEKVAKEVDSAFLHWLKDMEYEEE